MIGWSVDYLRYAFNSLNKDIISIALLDVSTEKGKYLISPCSSSLSQEGPISEFLAVFAVMQFHLIQSFLPINLKDSYSWCY